MSNFILFKHVRVGLINTIQRIVWSHSLPTIIPPKIKTDDISCPMNNYIENNRNILLHSLVCLGITNNSKSSKVDI